MDYNVLKHFKGIEIQFNGLEASDFLQRLCSQDILSLKDNDLKLGAFLDRRAKIISPFYCIKNKVLSLIISEEYKDDALSYIEKMHFGEDIGMSFQNITWSEERYIKTLNTNSNYRLCDWVIKEKLYKGVLYKNPQGIRINQNMKMEFDRLSYLAKSPGIDNCCFRSIMILDGPFDHYISRNKGCYPGQEVVEKIYQRRRPKEMFLCQIDSQLDTTLELPLLDKGKKIGMLLNPITDKNKHKSLAMAFVRSNMYASGDILDTDTGLSVRLN